MAQQSVRNGDPPCSAVVKIDAVVKKIRELDDNESLVAPKALCGRVVNLIIWEDALWDIVKSNIQIGTFLRLRNVDYQMWREGNMKGNEHRYSCKGMVLADLISLFSIFQRRAFCSRQVVAYSCTRHHIRGSYIIDRAQQQSSSKRPVHTRLWVFAAGR